MTLAALATLAVSSCGSGTEEKKERLTVRSIHALIDQNKYAEVMELSDARLREATSSKKMITLWKTLREECGKFLDARFLDRRLMEYGEKGEIEVSVLTVEAVFVNGSLREQFFFGSSEVDPKLVAFRRSGNCTAQAGPIGE